jgi:hypothetical protein
VGRGFEVQGPHQPPNTAMPLCPWRLGPPADVSSLPSPNQPRLVADDGDGAGWLLRLVFAPLPTSCASSASRHGRRCGPAGSNLERTHKAAPPCPRRHRATPRGSVSRSGEHGYTPALALGWCQPYQEPFASRGGAAEACPPGPVHALRRALACRTRLPALGTVGLFQSDRQVCCQ